MQTVIRLLIIWLVVGLFGVRIRCLHQIQSNPNRLIPFISYISDCMNNTPGCERKPNSISSRRNRAVFCRACYPATEAVDYHINNPSATRCLGHRWGQKFRCLLCCLLYASVILIVLLVLCLPKLWSFRIEKAVLHLYSNLTRSANLTSWQLVSESGSTGNEYCLATLGVLLPSCLLIFGLLVLTVKLRGNQNELKTQLLTQMHQLELPADDKSSAMLLLANHCMTILRWDTYMILGLGGIFALFWLPRAVTWQLNDIFCLIKGNDAHLDSHEPMGSSQTVWLWSELASLARNLISQVLFLIARSHSETMVQLLRSDKGWEHELDHCDFFGVDLETVDEEGEDIDNFVLADTYREHTTAIVEAGEPANFSLSTSETHQCLASPLIQNGNRRQMLFQQPTSQTISKAFHTGSCDTPCGSTNLRRRMLLSPFYSRKYNSNQYLVNSPHALRNLIDHRKISDTPHSSLVFRHASCSPSLVPYVNSDSKRVLLTYSPRSRHPCRIRNNLVQKISSVSPVSDQKSARSNRMKSQSPPPLPPPPTRRRFSMIGDSSVYSTPHASPRPQQTPGASKRSNVCSPVSNRVQFANSPLLSHHDDCGSVTQAADNHLGCPV